jgi:hypothetical protein
VQQAQDALRALEAELEAEVAGLTPVAVDSVPLDTIPIRPKRGAVDVRLVSLAWKPDGRLA